METVELKVDGMTCGSCQRAVGRVLSGMPGVEGVDVRLSEGAATVRGSGLGGQVRAMVDALAAAGYPARPAQGDSGDAGPRATRGGCGSTPGKAGGCCCG
jgi:copper chaperone